MSLILMGAPKINDNLISENMHKGIFLISRFIHIQNTLSLEYTVIARSCLGRALAETFQCSSYW